MEKFDYYKETKVFKLYNPNPRATGYKRKNWDTGDCTTRALCKFLDQDWNTVFKEKCELAMEMHTETNDMRLIEEYLTRKGCMSAGNKKDDKKQTAYTFALDNPVGTYYLQVANHCVCVKDGIIYDIWNSGEKSVYKVFYLPNGTSVPKMKRTRTKTSENV